MCFSIQVDHKESSENLLKYEEKQNKVSRIHRVLQITKELEKLEEK